MKARAACFLLLWRGDYLRPGWACGIKGAASLMLGIRFFVSAIQVKAELAKG